MVAVFRAGQLSAVALKGMDCSVFLNQADYASTLTTAETTHFGDVAKEFIPGVHAGASNLSGMFDATLFPLLSADNTFNTLMASQTTYPGTLFFDGGYAVGRSCISFLCNATSYAPSSPIGGVTSIKVGLQTNGQDYDGKCLSTLTPVTSITPVNFASVDNLALSSKGGTMILHVLANTWTGNATVKVQHSTDNSTWVDLTTQVVPTVVSDGFVVPVAGTVNRYVRSTITCAAGTGSITVIVAFARN